MSFGEIVNYILYGFSGICFGVFASRYSIFAALRIKEKYREEGLACFLNIFPQLLFLAVSFFLFPTWFISKTPTGGFFYYAFLIFFFNKGMRMQKNSK